MFELLQQVALWFVLLTAGGSTLLVAAAFIEVLRFELRGNDDFHY